MNNMADHLQNKFIQYGSLDAILRLLYIPWSAMCLVGLFGFFHLINDFNPLNLKWWFWLHHSLEQDKLPQEYIYAAYSMMAVYFSGLFGLLSLSVIIRKKRNSNDGRSA